MSRPMPLVLLVRGEISSMMPDGHSCRESVQPVISRSTSADGSNSCECMKGGRCESMSWMCRGMCLLILMRGCQETRGVGYGLARTMTRGVRASHASSNNSGCQECEGGCGDQCINAWQVCDATTGHTISMKSSPAVVPPRSDQVCALQRQPIPWLVRLH